MDFIAHIFICMRVFICVRVFICTLLRMGRLDTRAFSSSHESSLSFIDLLSLSTGDEGHAVLKSATLHIIPVKEK